ncbi:MAG: hypothetical protein RR056_05365 [Acetivibrio sp.]
MPIFLIMSILFVIWLGFQIKKTSKVSHHSSEDFWERERNANFVRPKDLSSLEYISVSLTGLPFEDTTDPTLSDTQEEIKRLSQKELLNLSSQSNTDLKYAYGAKNLDYLVCCDQNYALFLRTLNKWAALLYEKKETAKAKIILEYALSLKTDISTSYTLLAEIYFKEGTPEKIYPLITQAEELSTLMKDALIKNLASYLS